MVYTFNVYIILYTSVYTYPEEINQETASKEQGMVLAVFAVTEPGLLSISIDHDSTPHKAVSDSHYVHHSNDSRLHEFNNNIIIMIQ